jgi:dTDP-4-dehydrorhamnose 3,5-epimerase-like enzyme
MTDDPTTPPAPTGLPELASYWGGLVRVLQLPEAADPRGSLVAFDADALPFPPRRVFFVHSAPVGSVRGQHAHRHGQQVLCCVAGAVAVELRFGGETRAVVLDSPRRALLIGARVWSAPRFVAPASMLLVMVSEPYDPDGYVVEPA